MRGSTFLCLKYVEEPVSGTKKKKSEWHIGKEGVYTLSKIKHVINFYYEYISKDLNIKGSRKKF